MIRRKYLLKIIMLYGRRINPVLHCSAGILFLAFPSVVRILPYIKSGYDSDDI